MCNMYVWWYLPQSMHIFRDTYTKHVFKFVLDTVCRNQLDVEQFGSLIGHWGSLGLLFVVNLNRVRILTVMKCRFMGGRTQLYHEIES